MNINLESQDCSMAATCLHKIMDEAPEPQLILLCSKSLQEMADNIAWYTAGLTVSVPFFEELCATIEVLCQDANAPAGVMHDRAFGLVECLAVITRECILRQNTQQALPAQADIMRYFEGCGHWTPGDGTLVTEYYYDRIPQASTGH